MKVLLNIMFIRFYKMYYNSGERSDAQYTAILLIGLIIFINVYSLFSLFELLFFPRIEYSYYWLFALQVVIIIICYFVFVYKGKYKEIIEKLKHREKSKKHLDWFLILTYIAVSVFIWVYLASELRVFHLE